MSMTPKEALKILTGAEIMVLNRFHDKFMEAASVALNCLKEKAERENPRPLTIDDLLKMHGEPVYVTVPGKPHRSRWCIVDVCSPQPGLNGLEYFCHLSVAGTPAVNIYRHKPKEI